MPQGDKIKGKIAKFLGHAWEVVYQALFWTKNKKLPLIQFPKTRSALDSLLETSEKLSNEISRSKNAVFLKSSSDFRKRLANYLEAKKTQDRFNDCLIDEKGALRVLRRNFKFNKKVERVSLKSGSNYQIHSGKMVQICTRKRGQPSPSKAVFKTQLPHLKSKRFWNNYLGSKGEFFVVVDPAIRWRHYLMRDVVQALAENTIWHRTSEGRIKGKLPFIHLERIKKYSKIKPPFKNIRERKKYSIKAKKLIQYKSVITIERKGSSLLFAANGNCAQKMCEFLDQNIHHIDIKRASVADLDCKKTRKK